MTGFCSDQFKKMFFDMMSDCDKSEGDKNKHYRIVFCGGCGEDDCRVDLYHGIQLRHLVFSARNPYHLWLKVYEYIKSKKPEVADEKFYNESYYIDIQPKRNAPLEQQVAYAIEQQYYAWTDGDWLWCEEVEFL
jgi:hypothetical protein